MSAQKIVKTKLDSKLEPGIDELKTHSIKNLHIQPYSKKITELYQLLVSQEIGLSSAQAQSRLAQFGPNQLEDKSKLNVFKIVWDQFKDLLILILLFASIFSFIVGEKINGFAILLIMILNGILGFFQEFKAEKSLADLKKSEAHNVKVFRDDEEILAPAQDIVPGDVIFLTEGDQIPADCRIFQAFSFQVDESILTGESLAADKNAKVLTKGIGLADRVNMVFSGCLVTKGKAKALVIRTGMKTQLGQIATEINKIEKEITPLQSALNQLGRTLAIVSLAVSIPGLALGIFTGRDPVEMFMMAISLAVSAIPEGLPIVVTIALALGIKRMTKVKVLVRKLATAESLGGIDIICTDKTGTLTHNQMTVSRLYLPKLGIFEVTGSGFKLEGEVKYSQELTKQAGLTISQSTASLDAASILAQQAVLCSDANLKIGDPTERALVVLAHKLGLDAKKIHNGHKRVDELPFNSINKYMAVAVKSAAKQQAIIKGAPEEIIKRCQLTQSEIKHILMVNDHLASQGLRVLAIARQEAPAKKSLVKLNDYHFIGLVGMNDPPREAVPEAIRVCHRAGIRVIMITGDHKKTAQAVAQQIGLDSMGVFTGEDLDNMDEAYFKKVVKESNIFARVSPRHKVRILEILQNFGHHVAMTGDGVNDAPAIKKAGVGVAMGDGTDLTKGVADMILLDNDFANIPKAIYEGRRIFFNIKKFVRFMLSANFDEVARALTSILLGIPLSLLPIHILWLNLVTDSFPALALTVDKAEEGIMEKKPYNPQKEIMRGILSYSLIGAATGYVVIFSLFMFYLKAGVDITYARTISFITTVFFELFLVFSLRSNQPTKLKDFFSNTWLWLSVLGGVLVQLAAVYFPPLQSILQITAVKPIDWLVIVSFSFAGFFVIETAKRVRLWLLLRSG